MNDSAPVFGRGGWVCIALLLGFFAGGGIIWGVLAQRGAKSAFVVHRLPDPVAATAPLLHRTMPGPGSALEGTTRDDGVLEPVALEEDGTAGSLRRPGVSLRNDRILRGHPQAEGCYNQALAALAPFTKQRFELRDKVWDGDLSLDEGKAVACQLFKGNDYCFCVGTDAKGAKLSLQLYDHDGLPTEAEQTAQTLPAGANATAWLRCRQTGTYFVIVKLEAAAQEKVPWGMISAYR